MNPPVVLVHGWAGSFRTTWASTALVPLLEDAGRSIVGVDLLGHGEAPKPHDPEEYVDLTGRVLDAIAAAGTPVDAVGFSLGAMTLLRVACEHPGVFRRLVLAGIGENVLRTDDGHLKIVDALEGRGDAADVGSQAFLRYADQPGNDLVALAACMRRGRRPMTVEQLGEVGCETLVVIGDRDFAGPGEPLAEAIPGARLKVLRRVDHFATPEDFGFIDATLEFLDAIPA